MTFRGKQPTRLAFGTSGLRGLVTDITDLEAYINTRGFLDYATSCGDTTVGQNVAVAGDLRPSTDGAERSIARAVARAVGDAGMGVVNCGRIPTPALTYYGLQKGWPSIMVTGSHIPFDRNGIKFNRPTGEVLKTDEAPILAAVAAVRQREYARPAASSIFDDGGALLPTQRAALPAPTHEARELYVRRYLDAFAPHALADMRILLYEHSAVGRELIAEILRGLGAIVLPVGRASGFVAIDTEAMTAERLGHIQAWVDEARSRGDRVDAVVSTDGDSDRPMLLGVDGDGRVHFFGGDVLGTVVADYLEADSIAVPISSSDLIDLHFSPRNIPVVRTRIGSPWVIAAMSANRGERRVGWEANGGFLTASSIKLPGGANEATLAPLPTRDAVLPLVASMHAARRRNIGLVELFGELPARTSRAGLLDGVSPSVSRAIVARLRPRDDTILRIHATGDKVQLVRQAGVAEEPDEATARNLMDIMTCLTEHMGDARGFGPIADIDYLDGVRVRFHNGDVAHIRASGNAPQLRIYAVADTADRADEIVEMALAETDGIFNSLISTAKQDLFVNAVKKNIAVCDDLFQSGQPPRVIGTVSGSATAQAFWQHQLDIARPAFQAREAYSFHEDLPVNQAFGLLLLWQRLRPHVQPGDGALVAFVFGEGTRAAPLTEAECGQKPAISSFVSVGEGAEKRRLPIVELAMRTFAPVEAYLRRSGFDGVVVKWGDEVQIPTRNLAGHDPLFAAADVIRFVSMQEMTANDAANKDWVGVDDSGRITAFIPRRPLGEMQALADRGLLQRRGEALIGGINLGSIALSRALLDVLLQEFQDEVNDPRADRKKRPDLDPQLFTALVIATLEDPTQREAAFRQVKQESAAMAQLDANLPDVLGRLRSAVLRFERVHQRPLKIVAMDFGDQYWGDIGQHRQMFKLFMALREASPAGEITRALAGVTQAHDPDGNILAGDTKLGPGARARNCVLVDAHIESGEITDSVLIGTRCGALHATAAVDVQSMAPEMVLEKNAASYKVLSTESVHVGAGERVTTVYLPDGRLMMRVHEDTDLRDRAATYDVPILGNAISFKEAHSRVIEVDPADVERRRANDRQAVESIIQARPTHHG